MAVKTLYEIFDEYEEKDINEIVENLPELSKKQIINFYGEDLKTPKNTSFPKRFFYIIPLIQKKLSEYPKKNSYQINLIKSQLVQEAKSIFENNLNFMERKINVDIKLTATELVVLMLKNGLDDSIYYDDTDIAVFLGIEKSEVNEIIKKYFSKYKLSVLKLIDQYEENIIEDEIKSSYLANTSEIKQSFSPIAIIILLLKFGCINNKLYTNNEISNFFNIPISSITNFTKNYILERESLFKNEVESIVFKIAYDGNVKESKSKEIF